MDVRELRQFDLNTLVVLQVLLSERHVTRAAHSLGLTQSAVSRSLAKLRQTFNDPLLVKAGNRLDLTPKAMDLLPLLEQSLHHIKNLITPEVFDPKSHVGTIRLATTDYGTHSLLPRLVPLLADAAPNVQLSALEWPSDLLIDLEENKVDLLIGGTSAPSQDIHQRIVAHDQMCGIVRKGHPFEKGMTLDQYLGLNHIIISSSGDGKSNIDEILQQQGKKRRVAIRVPHFFAALEIIAATDYMILLPKHFARRYVDDEKFVTVEPPFKTPPLEISMFWHARMHHDALHKWFRNFIYESIYKKAKK